MAAGVVIALAAGGFAVNRMRVRPLGPGRVRDEARLAGRSSFVEPDEEYFIAMDSGIDLSLEETRGRNIWMLWSAGNDRFFDWLARYTNGEFDLLKLVTSYDPDRDVRAPAGSLERLKQLYPFRHDNRFQTLGITNEPCYDQAEGPALAKYGLWFDLRQPNCVGDPFEDDQKYPGVPGGMRGKMIPLGSPYGAPSGVIGLRLFPNPDFNDAAARNWDVERYYTDPAYYGSKDLVRPYRVGMTCAFCHAGLNPAKLPANSNRPEWENLSSTAGALGLQFGRVVHWGGESENYLHQVLAAARPGTVDTSLLVTDHIFNPRAITPIYGLPSRTRMARRWGRETLAGTGLDNRQLNTYVAGGPLAEFFEEPATVWTPRLGWNAMDSVGILGFVNRMFPAMGMFSEESLLHFNPMIGGTAQTPLDLKVGRQNSGYWQATEEMTPDVVRFLMRMEAPAQPGAPAADRAALSRGKAVFASRCASCHSSKFPEPPPQVNPAACSGDYAACWERYQDWTKTAAYQQEMLKLVQADDFLRDNYLSNDLRVPLPAVGTNACIALSSSGAAGQMWEQFTSQTYRALPSAGTITWYHPVTGAQHQLKLPAGGRGFVRPPSLIGVWRTAPYLANNAVGRFEPKADAESRRTAFTEAIEELLWPERREKDAVLGNRVPGKIDRTTARGVLRLPAHGVPQELQAAEIGPIPEGTPIGLLANLNLLDPRAVALLAKMKRELKSESDFAKFVDPLLELSACPDLVANRGHYFGTGLDGEAALTDQQKRDLIEFLRIM